MTKDVIIKAHQHSSGHRTAILSSEICGCFHCLEIFPSSGVKEWVDDGECALCPECGIDSVIGSTSGFPVTTEFLNKMKMYWFS